MLMAVEKARERVNLFNFGLDEYCDVNDSIAWITAHLGLEPEICYSGGERGWVGDNPFIYLDCSRIRRLGWTPKWNIREGMIRTLEFLKDHGWLLDLSRCR